MIIKFIAYCFLGTLLSFFISLFLTPLFKLIAIKLNILDIPNDRKMQDHPIPYLGGASIFFSFCLSFLIIAYFSKLIVLTNLSYAVILGGFVVFVTGLVDDKFNLKPYQKILGQVIASFIAIHYGLVIKNISIPFMDTFISVGTLGILLTVLWIVFITNSINLIDGLDGLASGIVSIASLSLVVFSFMIGNFLTAFLLSVLLGSTVGFLKFNFYPASIFMGDSGSLFLGYFIATVSLLELKSVTFISLCVPILILSAPIIDTLYAILRRKINHKPLFYPDRNHIHHRLLSLGWSQRKAVLTVYIFTFVLSAFSLFIPYISFWISLIFIVLYILLVEGFAEFIGLLYSNHYYILSFLKIFSKNKVK